MEKNEQHKYKKWGDRRDARLVRDISAYQKMIPYMYLYRCDNEAYFTEDIDLKNLNDYIDAKNKEENFATEKKFVSNRSVMENEKERANNVECGELEACGQERDGGEISMFQKGEESNSEAKSLDGQRQLTTFDCLVSAFVKVLTQNRKMNRFVQNKKLYDRDELSMGFTVKKQKENKVSDEFIAVKFDKTTTLSRVERKIKSEIAKINEVEMKEKASFSEKFLAKLPRFVLGFLTRIMMFLDLKGLLPKSVENADLNYVSVYFSNLNEIKINSGYHHLTNRGTTSIFVVVGERALKPVYDKDGNVKVREVLPLGITIDERIVDESYLSESLKLLNFLLQNPKMLERPANEDVEF